MTEEKEQRMERLFHDHYEQMYRFAFALLHDNEEARDVVSDVFSRLWDKHLTPIAGHFHLQVTYQNESARHIRLFLQLEKNMSLDDIIELMNHFEKVNIRHEGQTLIVE
jgi:hypothetical protein